MYQIINWIIVLFVPFSNNIWSLCRFVVPIPPRETIKIKCPSIYSSYKPLPFTDKGPDDIFEAFKEVNEAPKQTKLEADKVLMLFPC